MSNFQKSKADQIASMYHTEDELEKAKAFAIGQLDKSGRNIKTANGWVPVKKHLNTSAEDAITASLKSRPEPPKPVESAANIGKYDHEKSDIDWGQFLLDVPDKALQQHFFYNWQSHQAKKFDDKQANLGLPFNNDVRKMFTACHKLGINLDSNPEEFYSEVSKLRDGKDFETALLFRGALKINKHFKGNWRHIDLPVLRNMEYFAHVVPKGHFLNNKSLTAMNNHSSKEISYAHYSPYKQEISFSDLATSRGQRKGDLKNPSEFEHVFAHELGHAVSRKMRSLGKTQFHKLTSLFGWEPIDSEKHGSEKFPVRRARTAFSLLSDYSNVSPEEAFAEYYSMYLTNKEFIDSTLANPQYWQDRPNHTLSSGRNHMSFKFFIGGNTREIFELFRDQVFRRVMIKSLEDSLNDSELISNFNRIRGNQILNSYK